MKNSSANPNRNSNWNFRSNVLFFTILMSLMFIESCKKPVDEVSASTSSFTSYVINSPNQPIALIIQNELATESITVSANRTTNGNFKHAISVLFYDANFGIAANVKLGKDYLIDEIEAFSDDTKRIATFSNYNLIAGTVRIKVTDKKNNELIAEDQEIKLTAEIIANLNELKNLYDQDGKGFRLAAESCNFKSLAKAVGLTLACIRQVLVTVKKVTPCAGLAVAGRLNPLSTALALWCLERQKIVESTSKIFIPCDKASNKIEEIYGPCKEEAKEQLEKAKNQLDKIKCVINNWKDINSINDLKKKYNECSDDPKSNNPNSASGIADPHLITSDGVSYDFQSHGEFIATKSSVDNFEIQVRQEEYNRTGVASINTAIAIQTGSDVVCATIKPNRLYINKQVQDLANLTTLPLKDGASITKTKERNADVLNITLKNGDLLKVAFQNAEYIDYYLYLADNRKGRVFGLLGNYDGDKTNDIVVRNGENILQNGSLSFDKLYPTYADSWRITQANSLFYYDSGKNTESYTQKDFPRTLQTLTADQKTKAESVCRAAGVSSEPFLSNCIFDVAITGNNDLAKSSLWGQQNDARNSMPVPLVFDPSYSFLIGTWRYQNGAECVYNAIGKSAQGTKPPTNNIFGFIIGEDYWRNVVSTGANQWSYLQILRSPGGGLIYSKTIAVSKGRDSLIANIDGYGRDLLVRVK